MERPTMQEIIKQTCKERGYKIKDIMAHFRWKDHVWTRALITTRARAHGYSYSDIGRALKLHHTTIMNMAGCFPNKNTDKKVMLNEQEKVNEVVSGS